MLLVEDNPEVAEVTLAMLEQLGYGVDTRGNAAAALEAMATQTFDLVVSDIVMAGEWTGWASARTHPRAQPGAAGAAGDRLQPCRQWGRCRFYCPA